MLLRRHLLVRLLRDRLITWDRLWLLILRLIILGGKRHWWLLVAVVNVTLRSSDGLIQNCDHGLRAICGLVLVDVD